MDRTQRAIIHEKIHTHNVMGHHLAHELYRAFTVHKTGLTPKEIEWLKIRHERLTNLLNELSEFRQRRLR